MIEVREKTCGVLCTEQKSHIYKNKKRKKENDRTVDSLQLFNLCHEGFWHCQSNSSLKYHLNAEHIAISSEVSSSPDANASISNQARQATLNKAFRLG